MSPLRAFAWTAAYILTGSFAFWSVLSVYSKSVFKYWQRDILFLSIFVLLSYLIYRKYRRDGCLSFAKRSITEQRRIAFACGVSFSSLAVLGMVLSLFSTYPLSHFATWSVWLVVGADNFRHYKDSKNAEASVSK